MEDVKKSSEDVPSSTEPNESSSTSSSSSAESSYHEVSQPEVDSNTSKSSDSFQSCQAEEKKSSNEERDDDDDGTDDRLENNRSPSGQGDGNDNISDDDDDDDDDDDSDSDDDQVPNLSAIEAESTSPPPERPTVLSKSETKPSFNFVRDYVASRQYSMTPTVFKSRRRADLGLVQRFKLSHKLEGHTGCVNAIHFNESGSRLASGSDDLEVIVWDWMRGRKICSFPTGHTSNVFQSKFLPLTGDTHIVTSSRDGQVRLAQLSETGTCQRTKKVAQHKRASHKLALLPDRPHQFISGGEDGLIFDIDVRADKPTKLLVQKEEDDRPVGIFSVHANPVEDHLIITAGSDQFVRLFDRRYASMSHPEPVQKFCPQKLTTNRSLHITCAVFSQTGKDVVASFCDEDIYLFDSKGLGPQLDARKHYQGHKNSATVKGINFYGSDSEFVVSGSDDGHIFFWSREGEDIVHIVEGDENGVVNCLEPHPNLPWMATSGLDDEVKVWSPSSQNRVERSYVEKAVMKNADKSARDTYGQGSILSGQMLWQILRQMRRSERRRGRQEETDDQDHSTSNDDDDDTSDDLDDDDGPVECAQS